MAIDYNKKAEIQIEVLVGRLRRETRVSEKFLNEVRPAIEKTYLEVPEGTPRETCLQAIWDAAKRQEEIQESAEQAREAARKLRETGIILHAKLRDLSQNLQDAKNALAATALSLYTFAANSNGKQRN